MPHGRWLSIALLTTSIAALACARAVAQPAAAANSASTGDATATSTPNRPTPQQKLARIWANEPPLVQLARNHFGSDGFTETDAKFFAAVADNQWADFRPMPETEFDVAQPASWDEAPKLPADRIVWLCTDPAAAKLVPSHGIWLRGVEVNGKINLYRTTVPFSLTFYDCLINDGLNIGAAKMQEIDIRYSCSAAINAREMSSSENVYLIESSVFGGANFTGAQIAGDFNFSGGLAFHGITAEDLEKPGVALDMYDAKIGGDVLLNNEFRSFGMVRLIGAQVGRSFTCSDSRFVNVHQTAIDARASQIAGNAKFTGDCSVEGGANVSRMRIGGDLDCDGGRFIASDVDALNADLVNVSGQVLFGDGFHAEGEVRMINATVAGNVDCDDGTFHHPDGDALSLDGATIGRGLHIGTNAGAASDNEAPHFAALGTVRLLGTKIEADLFSDGGEFQTPGGTAILANNVRIGSRLVMTACDVAGTVDFSSAQIEHEADLRGTRIDGTQSTTGRALIFGGAAVGGSVYCNLGSIGQDLRPFRALGYSSFQFATIGMYWDLTNAEFDASETGGFALDASDARVAGYINLSDVDISGEASFSRAKIEGVWYLHHVRHPERLILDLRFAHIWVIKDEKLEDWPPAGQLKLEGLVYNHFDDESPLGVEDRLEWLARQYVNANSKSTNTVRANRSRNVFPASYDQLIDEREYIETSVDNNLASVEDDDSLVEEVADAVPQQMAVNPNEAQPLPAPGDDATEGNEFEVDPPAETSKIDVHNLRRYVTQPYTQLASVYQAIGQDEQAAQVLVARAERLGEMARPLSAHGIWYRYVGKLIGYGYEPFRAVKIGLAIVFLGAIVFAIGNRRHLMAETKLAEHVLSQEGEPRLISPTYPRFNPLVYSLDVFLPFVDLQQICYWIPGENSTGSARGRNCLLHLGGWSLKWSALLRVYLWFQTLAGWTLCTLLAAAVTGIVKS